MNKEKKTIITHTTEKKKKFAIFFTTKTKKNSVQNQPVLVTEKLQRLMAAGIN